MSNKISKIEKKQSKLKTSIHGFLIGLSNGIPGVSGGTMAFILGIYEQFIYSLSKLNISFLFLYISAFFKNKENKKKTIKKASIKFHEFNPGFLSLLLLFALIGMVVSLLTINSLIKKFPIVIFSFFIGLIISSFFLIYLKKTSQIKKNKTTLHFNLFLGIIIGTFLSIISVNINSHNIFLIFVSGIIATCAMLLPGLSGSYMLVILNQYEYITDSIKYALKSIISGEIFLSWSLELIAQLKVLLIFSIGIILSFVLFSKLLSYLLKKHHNTTIFLVLGIMVGGLMTPILNIIEEVKKLIYANLFNNLLITTIFSIIFLLIGIYLVIYLNKISKTEE